MSIGVPTPATVIIMESIGLPSRDVTGGDGEGGRERWIEPPDPHRKNNKVCKRKF